MPGAPTSLRDLWSIEPESFRALLEPSLRWRSAHPPRGQKNPVSEDPLLDRALPRHDCTSCRCEAIRVDLPRAFLCAAQLMRGSGIYGLPELESAGLRSASGLRPAPPPRAGDRVGSVFELAALEEGRALVWRTPGPIELLGHVIEALAVLYRVNPAGANWTRLTTCVRAYAPGLTPSVRSHLLAAVDIALIAPQVEAVRMLAERPACAAPSCSGVGQAAAFHAAGR